MKLNSIQKAILQTLIFFNIFDYPLKFEEIKNYLYNYHTSKNNLPENLQLLKNKSIIGEKKDFFYLLGRSRIVETRKERKIFSHPKWRKALRASRWLEIIPFIKTIAVCNTLSYDNVKENSDIDFFIICSTGRIWTARFFSTVLLSLVGLRRVGTKINNRICLSFYLSDSSLNLSKIALRPEDPYLNYWIFQLKPITDRDKSFNKFLLANTWVKKFLPNYSVQNNQLQKDSSLRFIRNILEKLMQGAFGNYVENKLKKHQLRSINQKNRIVNPPAGGVITNDSMLKFHPKDKRAIYRQEFLKGFDQ